MTRRRTETGSPPTRRLILVGITFALPLAWVVLSSLDADANLKVKFPTHATFDNFDAVLKPDITFTPLLNSLILCGGATALTVVCAALAARIRCPATARA